MTREEAATILYKEWQRFLEDNLDYAGISDAYMMAIKILKQEPCEDAISRADVKKYLSAPDANGDRVIYESDLDLLPSVTPSYNSIKTELKSSEDCISRQAVKEQMIKYGFSAPDMTVTEFVEDLPSVTPQPKIGYWTHNKCDKCGASRPPLFDNYCPYCGDKKIEPQTESEVKE